jgi:hypothetical protein
MTPNFSATKIILKKDFTIRPKLHVVLVFMDKDYLPEKIT